MITGASELNFSSTKGDLVALRWELYFGSQDDLRCTACPIFSKFKVKAVIGSKEKTISEI